jgi:starvation-inducible outer membrane lipoprotein
MSSDSWKEVPSELIFGIEDVWATPTGRVRIGGIECKQYRGAKGKYGIYPITTYNDHTLYFHRLVFFAHSGMTVDELKRGRVVFKNFEDPTVVVDDRGLYRCWLEDLTFEKSRFAVSESDIPESVETNSHIYGNIAFGEWKPVYTINKTGRALIKSSIYEICFINKPDIPCIIRNKERNTIVKYHFHDGLDGYINLKHNSVSQNFKLTHIMIASAFPTIKALDTVDHTDNDPKNHNILNLRWLSSSENARKGQSIQVKTKKEQPDTLPGEEWKSLPISDYTRDHYEVSNRGRVRRIGHGFLNGSRLRGKKYTYFTITTELNNHVKFYAHQLVFATFHGPLGEGQIILHDDMAPLNEDGTYRNWAEDLRAGSKGENNIEYHSAKRTTKLTPSTEPIPAV